MSILQDETIITDKMKMIISILYQAPDYKLNAGAMIDVMGYTSHAPLNNIVGTCGRKIKANYIIPPAKITEKWHWTVVFNGDEELKNKFNWILKPNMIEALNKLNLFESDAIFSEMLQENSDARQFVELLTENKPITAEDRSVIAKRRVGQSKFRARLIEKYNGTCCLCGLSLPQLLVASHIKPWAYSNPIQKADINNGLLLCRNHDALFDKFLISFDKTGQIRTHETITQTDYAKLCIHNGLKIE